METPSIKLPKTEAIANVPKKSNTALAILSSNPLNFYEKLRVCSPGQHFLNDSLSLSQIKTELGETGIFTIKALLNVLVCDLVEFFNVGKSMDDNQIIRTVDLILQEYSYFKPEDFKLCFDLAKKGKSGKLFDRIDGQVILIWLGEYDNERTAEIEDIRQTENTQLKRLEAKPLLTTDEKDNADKDELFKQNIAILLEHGKERKRQKLEAERVRIANSTSNKGPVYDMHQRWIKQFDLVWKRQGYPANRLIKRYGMVKNPALHARSNQPKLIPRMLDISAYLEHKQWQYNQYVILNIRHYEVQEKSL